MTLTPRAIADFAVRDGAVVRVEVDAVRGSTPREAGAFMLVSEMGLLGTIGGGQLEFLAIDRARRMLRDAEAEASMSVPLGPDIGQCCGGRADLALARLDAGGVRALVAQAEAERAALPHAFVFGAGHVGRALAHALAPLPLCTTVTDARPDALDGLPESLETRSSVLPEALVRAAPPGSAFVILTHDHALDFLIAREALTRGDAAYVGMIGSKSKRATFANWFRREGGDMVALNRLVCPIGSDRIRDKRPEVIATLVAAELVGHLLGPGDTMASEPAYDAARGQ